MQSTETRLYETRKPTDLKPHPRQAYLFGTWTEHEIKELATNMDRYGLLVPVEVLPDGTIIAGHKRVAAAILLGWAEITVWVRKDLDEQGPAAVERRLIEDNLDRRQLGPLEIARCYRELKALGRRPGHISGPDRQDLRDQIGKRLGVSGRTLDRWLRVLDTPIEVQNAVATNQLPSTLGEKVAGLLPKVRDQIAAEIRDGGKPAEVVRRHLPKGNRKHNPAGKAVWIFFDVLKRGVADLEGHVEQMPMRLKPEENALLDQAERLIQAIRQRATATANGPTQQGVLADELIIDEPLDDMAAE